MRTFTLFGLVLVLATACGERHHPMMTRIHLHTHSHSCKVDENGASPCPIDGIFDSATRAGDGIVLEARKDVSAEVVYSRIDCFQSYVKQVKTAEENRSRCPFALDPIRVVVIEDRGTVSVSVKSPDPQVLDEFAKRVKEFPGQWEL